MCPKPDLGQRVFQLKPDGKIPLRTLEVEGVKILFLKRTINDIRYYKYIISKQKLVRALFLFSLFRLVFEKIG